MKNFIFRCFILLCIVLAGQNNICQSAVVSVTSGSGMYNNRIYNNSVYSGGTTVHNGISPTGTISERVHYRRQYRPVHIPAYGGVNYGYPVNSTHIRTTGMHPSTPTVHQVNVPPPIHNITPTVHQQRYYLPQDYTYTSTTTYYPIQTIYVNNGNGPSGSVSLERQYTTTSNQGDLIRLLSW